MGIHSMYLRVVDRTSWRALIAGLLVASAALATDGAPEPSGYWTGDIHAPTPASLQGGHVIHATELTTLLKRRAAVIDASDQPHRPDNLPADSVWLPVPHKAIPGALWIPGSGAGEIRAEVDALFRSRLASMTSGQLTMPVVVYCHEKCWLSWNAAKRALSYGYREVYWFPEGIEGWTAAGQPTYVIAAVVPIA